MNGGRVILWKLHKLIIIVVQTINQSNSHYLLQYAICNMQGILESDNQNAIL